MRLALLGMIFVALDTAVVYGMPPRGWARSLTPRKAQTGSVRKREADQEF